MNFIRNGKLLTGGSRALECHGHNPSDQFQGHLYNNETLNSHESTKNLEDIENIQRLKSSFALVSAFKYQIAFEDVAIFIGTTKSGKSTLINYLLGNKLIGVKDRFKPVFIQKVDKNLGPVIGSDLASETSIPTRWKSPKLLTNIAFWDPAGFADNRGPTQDIINAFYIKELFVNVKSAKIVIVSDISDILSDRINSFLSLLNSVEYIFNEHFKDHLSNIIIVFTKVPNEFEGEPLTVDYISELLKYKISLSSSIQISQLGKEFLDHISLNKQQIALFKKATVGSIITNSIDDGIVKAMISINGIRKENLVKVSPSISPESKVFLFKIRNDLTSSMAFAELNKMVHSMSESLLNQIMANVNDNQTSDYLKTIQNDLVVLQNKVKSIIDAKSFHEKINFLQTMGHDIKHKIDEENLVGKAEIIEFVDGLLNLKQSDIFNASLQLIFQQFNANINTKIVEIKLLLKEIDKEEAKIQLQEIRKHAQTELKITKEEYEKLIRENERAKRFFGKLGDELDKCISGIINTTMYPLKRFMSNSNS